MTDGRELKLKILRYFAKLNDHDYKFNLVGRDHAPGKLELEQGERWTDEQRLAAAYAFDELKNQRMLRPTLSSNPDPDNWVKITDVGIEALKTGVVDENAPQALAAPVSNARRDLEIMVSEHEAFPNEAIVKDHPVASKAVAEMRMMRHSATVLNILIASPSDVTEEREVVTKTIYDWNAAHFSNTGIMLNPVRWESHSYPASGNRPQAIVNKQIVESGDILIGIFGYRLGTPTGVEQSGTIEEIEEFRKAGKYVALYFSSANVPRSADRDQLEALEAYKKERKNDTLYFTFEDAQGLRDHLTRQLPKIVQDVRTKLQLTAAAEHVTASPQPAPLASARPYRSGSHEFLPELNPKEIELLVCAARDSSGQIGRRKAIGGDQLHVGNRTFVDSCNARDTAQWLGALKGLVSEDLLEDVGQNGEFYRVTDFGYAAADLLEDFTRWPTNQVTVEALYLNAPTESLTLACSSVIQLPAVYYQYRIRADRDVMRSEKEPRTLFIEGIDLKELNKLTWKPSDLSFVISGTNETKSFMVERTEDLKVAKFRTKN
jgi:hypothetical protein